jgi:hypothetical protein
MYPVFVLRNRSRQDNTASLAGFGFHGFLDTQEIGMEAYRSKPTLLSEKIME